MSAALNPGFSFDVGAAATQAPWGLTGLVSEAKNDPASQHGTTADRKVQRRLAAKAAALNGKSHGVAAPAAKKRKTGSSSLQPRDSSDDGAGASSGGDSEDSGDVELPAERQDTSGASASDDEGGSSGTSTDISADQVLNRDGEGATSPAEDGHDHEQPPADGDRPKKPFFDQAPRDTKFVASSFASLNLSRPLVKACTKLGYTSPTPIQAACVPLALLGRDICGSAQTGSGKTAAFALPLLERLLYRSRRVPAIYVLVLTPTRELAVQVHSMISRLAQFTDIRMALVVGGLSLQVQATALRSSPEIVVATPGRLIDHLRNTQLVGLEDLQALVLDEADRLLSMGFTDEVQQIVEMAPRERQTMLFSATMTEDVEQLVRVSLRRPVRLAADVRDTAPAQLAQEIVRLKGGAAVDKEATLLALASSSYGNGRTIVFFSTKVAAHRAKLLFGLAELLAAAELHGNMSQTGRLEALDAFRKGEVAFLLATDVAARGLDILGVENVINYDAPRSLEDYLHRIGRTARAGAAGRALTFVEDGDRGLLKQVVKRAGVSLHARVPVAKTVREWAARIERLEGDVAAILAQERQEMELRRAEMQANKAQNMIDHEEAIMARPARSWFQTPKQKKQVAAAAKEEVSGGKQAAGKGAKAAKNAAAKGGKKARGRREEQEPEDTLEEQKAVARGIRAVKHREAAFRGQGIAGGKAGKMARESLQAEVLPKKKKASQKRPRDEDDANPEAAALKRPSKVYAGGAKSQRFEKPTISKRQKNLAKRHGTGKHAFKSKARHKRRK